MKTLPAPAQLWVINFIPNPELFGIPDKTDSFGTDTQTKEGVVQDAVKALKEKISDLVELIDSQSVGSPDKY